MSRTKQVIELSAPAVMRESRPERFTLTGFTCPECQGNGWGWQRDVEEACSHEYVKAPCPVCGGTGELDVEVTVSWKKQSARQNRAARDMGKEVTT